MEDKKKLNCFSMSKFTNYEMIMDSMFASSGAHQVKVLEKFEKNNKGECSCRNILKVGITKKVIHT